MIREHSEVTELFADPHHRPHPDYMANLIQRGLTEEELITTGESQGYRLPIMEQALADLEVVIPYIKEVVEDVAEQSGDGRLIFAARDAELLYDHCKVAIPDADAHLLPASSSLWDEAHRWHRQTAQQFLGRYGLDEASIEDTDNTFTLVDTGFYGSIGESVDYAIRHTYGVDLPRHGRLSTKLVCAEPDGLGKQITTFSDTDEALDPTNLPRTMAWLGPAAFLRLYQDRMANFRLAVTLQTMPQYHSSFVGITMRDGIADAVIHQFQQPSCDDIDTPPNAGDININPSVVNPLAAAVVQYHVVNAALEAKED